MDTRQLHVNFEGHQIAVLAVNEHLNGSPLVFIPGVMAPVNFWNSCLPNEILEQKCWYSISLPGHHPSVMPEDLKPQTIDEKWLSRLYQTVITELVGDKKVIVIGHSTGGFSALNLAVDQFEQLEGIISIAGFYEGQWGGIEGQLVKLAHLGRWAKPLFIFNLWLGRLFKPVQRFLSGLLAYDRKAYFASPVSTNMLLEIQDNMKEQNLAALFPLFSRIPTLNIGERLSSIKAPTVIMAGTHDPVISAAQSLNLAGAIEHAKLIIFDRVGHMPFMERSEQFQRELLEAVAFVSSTKSQ